MKHKKNYLLPLTFLVSFLFYNCSNSLPIYDNWHGDIAERRGKYIFKEKHLELDLFDEDGIFCYFLIQNKTDTLVRTQENASIWHSYFLYLDDEENLWVSSGDIGDWVWLKTDGTYTKHFLSKIDRKLIPQKVWKNLPESSRDVYEK